MLYCPRTGQDLGRGTEVTHDAEPLAAVLKILAYSVNQTYNLLTIEAYDTKNFLTCRGGEGGRGGRGARSSLSILYPPS